MTLSALQIHDIKRLRAGGVSQENIAAAIGACVQQVRRFLTASDARREYERQRKTKLRAKLRAERGSAAPPHWRSREVIERVAALRAEGLTYSAIGQRLGLSRKAVDGIVRREKDRQASGKIRSAIAPSAPLFREKEISEEQRLYQAKRASILHLADLKRAGYSPRMTELQFGRARHV